MASGIPPGAKCEEAGTEERGCSLVPASIPDVYSVGGRDETQPVLKARKPKTLAIQVLGSTHKYYGWRCSRLLSLPLLYGYSPYSVKRDFTYSFRHLSSNVSACSRGIQLTAYSSGSPT